MDANELGVQVEELEERVERLRALYDQYFMGIERLEPLILRKDVERRVNLLRREQIRNTAMRFKLQMIVQRYNTYQQFWARTCREIENGTYSRDLRRAAERFGDAALTAMGQRRRRMFEKGMVKRAERDAARANSTSEHGHESAATSLEARASMAESDPVGALAAGGTHFLSDAAGAGEGDGIASLDLEVAEDFCAPEPREASGAPSPAPVQASDAAARGVLASQPGEAGRAKLPSQQARPSLPGAHASSGIAEAPTRTSLPGAHAPSAWSAAQPRPARPTSPLPTTQPRPAQPSSPLPAAQPRPAQPSSPLPAAQPRPAQPSSPSSTRSPAPVTRPAFRPTSRPPPPPGAPSELSPTRLRQIYSDYVEAKRRCHESTATLTYEKLATNLQQTAKQMADKHKGRAIDFEVIVKNGNAVLRPVVKG